MHSLHKTHICILMKPDIGYPDKNLLDKFNPHLYQPIKTKIKCNIFQDG
jgi:hypothetical protein